MILAPVEDKNKKKKKKKKSVYRKRALLILMIEICGLFISLALHFTQVFHTMAMALFCIGALLIAGFLKNRLWLNT